MVGSVTFIRGAIVRKPAKRWGHLWVANMIRREPVITEGVLFTFVGCLALAVAALAAFRWVI
jgi:hypothetical protein